MGAWDVGVKKGGRGGGGRPPVTTTTVAMHTLIAIMVAFEMRCIYLAPGPFR